MRTEQTRWKSPEGWQPAAPGRLHGLADLVLAFGSTDLLSDTARLAEIRVAYPRAHVIACSTSGEICGGQVTDDSLVVTAMAFDDAWTQVRHIDVRDCADSREAGERLATSLPKERLVHVMVFSDGHLVNGSALVEGLAGGLPKGVAVTGGLAGDGARFQRTLVGADGAPSEGTIAVVGFYGDRIRVGYGSLGGWDPFGPERLITSARGNVLLELDGEPALPLYKRYLGEHAAGLPSTGLRFPLSVRTPDGRQYVRTILAVNEEEQSLTFAGDLPVGARARLMKANFDRLVDGAHGAATTSWEALGRQAPEVSILISCVGRKLVLQQRTEEEVEAVRSVLGGDGAMTGFYSYGEICPAAPNASCELHNQTMTITTLTER
jgi:hypothetical protein